MGVYDEAEYPFLRDEHRFLLRVLGQGVPLLGICLGSQLLAKALGARVYRNPHKEIGWYTVDLTPAGAADPLFAGLTSPVPVFQWHGDAFALPAGATPWPRRRSVPTRRFATATGSMACSFIWSSRQTLSTVG